jgi:glycogen phosphorylase
MSTLGSAVSAARMVKDYTGQLYEPTAARADALTSSGLTKAKDLAAWKQRVIESWSGVHVDSTETELAAAGLGDARVVHAVVALGELGAGDVEVQLVHGVVGQNDELVDPVVTSMGQTDVVDDHHVRYEGSFACDRAGRYGYTVRVVPHHADLASPVEMGCVAWAAT